MKRCPKCNSQYSDLTLSFCLQDGTSLVDVKQSSVDTVAFARPVTAEKIAKTEDFRDIAPPNETPRAEFKFAPYPQPPRSRKRSHKGLMVGILSVLMFMIVAAFGVFGWLYLSAQKPVVASTKTESHEPYAIAPMNVAAKPSDIVSNDTPADTAPKPSTTSSNPDAIRREITSDIDSWKRSSETCDVSGYAARYGEKIEYHDHHGVAVDEIKHEIQKTCDTFSKIEIKVDNMVVAVDAEGDAVTAIFDKEWRYEASPKLAQGKVHMKLHFRKVTDGWKIVSEQNLKTYYSKS